MIKRLGCSCTWQKKYTESCVLPLLVCNLSLKYQIRKLGDTKYQTGKYQIGKYLASFAWTSVAQLAEVSKPGIARERDGQGDFSTARNLPSSSWAGSQASTGARRPRWLRWRPASRTAPNSLGGAAAPSKPETSWAAATEAGSWNAMKSEKN